MATSSGSSDAGRTEAGADLEAAAPGSGQPVAHLAVGDDVGLLRRVAERDRAALAALYERYAARLGRYVGRLVGRPEAVGEVINDVMLAVWQGADRYDPGIARPSTWLYGIAHNKARKAIERQARARELPLLEGEEGGEAGGGEAPGGAATPEQVAMSRQLGRSLELAMRHLSADHRAVIQLAFGEDLSYQEIAAITECPVNTVKTRVFHARRRLAELLDRAAAGALAPAEEPMP